MRLAASLLTKLVDSLAPSITSILVHGKQVSDKQGPYQQVTPVTSHSHFNVH